MRDKMYPSLDLLSRLVIPKLYEVTEIDGQHFIIGGGGKAITFEEFLSLPNNRSWRMVKVESDKLEAVINLLKS